MQYVIFALLVASLVFTILFYENRLSVSKRQLIVLTRQVNDLRSKLSLSQRKNTKLSIKYLIPNNRMGITNNNIDLHLSPVDDSPVLQKLSVKMEVSILDKASIGSMNWFYIEIPSDNNINCRGWIKQQDFSIFYDSTKTMSKAY